MFLGSDDLEWPLKWPWRGGKNRPPKFLAYWYPKDAKTTIKSISTRNSHESPFPYIWTYTITPNGTLVPNRVITTLFHCLFYFYQSLCSHTDWFITWVYTKTIFYEGLLIKKIASVFPVWPMGVQFNVCCFIYVSLKYQVASFIGQSMTFYQYQSDLLLY